MSKDKIKDNMTAIVLAVLIAVGVAGGVTLVANNDDDQAVTTQSNVENEAIFSADQKTVTYKGETGKTALAVIQSLTVVTGKEDPSLGFYVTGINGVEADNNKNEFWAFYVDGESAQVGAGAYDSMNGEELKWVLETF